jgi:E3 ubiquitin-protein ligase RNF14
LQDFYNNAITEGDLASVRCLAPDCAKNRSADRNKFGKKRKQKTNINPSELLQIPLEHDMVKRYAKLKHKAELESDKSTIYCPRSWCQGAARSRKHRKPSQFLDNIESSDEESDDGQNQATAKSCYTSRSELLSICEDCSFAFCSRCYQGWHGEFTICSPRTNTGELTDEDKASMEYLKLHTTPCPTCAAPAQKTHGCNHMICFRCNTHFCYLCSAWLEPENPYRHYNLETASCYMRLWELEAGDGDDVGIGFAGGVQVRERAAEPVELVEIREEEYVLDGNAIVVPEEPAPPPVVPLAEPFAREGPLVLRIGLLHPWPAPPQAAAQPPAAHRNRHQQRQVDRQREPPIQPPVVVAADPARLAPRRPNQRAPHQPAPRQVARAGAAGAANRNAPADADMQEAAHRAWVQNFVQMALNDEEDLLEWDSNDEEDIGAWVIPVR